MFSSMTRDGQACQEGLAGPGEALAGLARFRREFYRCLWRRGDALCELADAALTAPAAGTLPYLSLEPGFRRGHGMLYQALDKGRIDEEALRDLLVRWRPRGWPLVFAVDASTYPRPAAAASPGGSGTRIPVRGITAAAAGPAPARARAAAPAGKAGTGTRWSRAGRSSGWPSCRSRRTHGPRRRTWPASACGTTRPGRRRR